MIKIARKCRTVALRHLPRTHKIDVSWLFEVCAAPEVEMRHVKTDAQVADLMTKAFTASDKWEALLRIAQIRTAPTKPDRCAVGAVAREVTGSGSRRRFHAHRRVLPVHPLASLD